MGFMDVPVAAGDFVTYLKYDARAGRFYTKPDGGGDIYEVTNMTAVVDIENIRTGWFEFSEGRAPTKVFDPSLTEAVAKPGPDAKRGFEVRMFSDKNIGGLREFASTAAAVIEPMNALYDAWLAGKDANPGKLPVVKCKGVHPVKSGQSTNYQPTFEIVSWADRPAELAGETAAPPAAKSPPKAAPATAGGDGEVEF